MKETILDFLRANGGTITLSHVDALVEALTPTEPEPIIVAEAPAEWDPRSPEALEPTTPTDEPTP